LWNCQPGLFAFIFPSAGNINSGFAPSSRREQRSSALHLVFQIYLQYKKEPIPFGIGSFLELLARFELATVLPRKVFRGSPNDLRIEIDEVASSVKTTKKELQTQMDSEFFWSC